MLDNAPVPPHVEVPVEVPAPLFMAIAADAEPMLAIEGKDDDVPVTACAGVEDVAPMIE